MQLLDLYKKYQALQPEQKEFVKTRKVEGTYKIKDWLSFFKEVAIFDEILDQTRDSLQEEPKRGRLWLAFFVIGIALSFLVENVMLGLLLATPIFLLVFGLAKLLKKIDLSNGLRLHLIPLLMLFHEEAGGQSKLELSVDASNIIDHKAYLVRKKERPITAVKSKWDFFYENTWAQGKLTFEDSTQVKWEIFSAIRHRLKMKSGRKRGSEFKVKHSIRCKVAMPQSRYALSEPENAEVPCQEKNGYWVFKVKGDETSTDPYQCMSVQTSIKAIIKAYQQVRRQSEAA